MNCIFLRRGYGTSGDGVNYVEYIESDGTQYIDTGFKPKYNTRVVVDVAEVATESYLFGARDTDSTTATKQYGLYYNASKNMRSDYFGTNASLAVADASGRATIDKNGNVVSLYGSTITNTAVTSGETSYPLWLFAVNNVGSAKAIATMKLYSCQIYDNGTLVRDYRPALDPDGVPCLYEKVSKTYYYNKGTGTFTAGASIGGGSSSGYVVNIVDNVTYDVFTVTIGGTAYTSNATVPIEAGTAITVKLDNENASNAIYLNGTQVAINSTASQGYTFVPNSNTTITFTLVNADQGRWDCYITT